MTPVPDLPCRVRTMCCVRRVLVALASLALPRRHRAAEGRLEIHVVDRQATGQPLAAPDALQRRQGQADQAAQGSILERPLCLRRHDRRWSCRWAHTRSSSNAARNTSIKRLLHAGAKRERHQDDRDVAVRRDEEGRLVVGRSAHSPAASRHRAPDAGRRLARRAGHYLVEQYSPSGKAKSCPISRWCQFDGDRFYHLLAGEDEARRGRACCISTWQSRCRSPARSASIPRP